MTVSKLGLLFVVALLAGCPAVTPDNGNNADSGQVVYLDAASNNNANQNNNNFNVGPWKPPTNSRIYVNTKDTLFYIDPGQSNALVTIGDFTGACVGSGTSGLYDIAVSDASLLIGIAAEALYTIDADTAVCTEAFEFPAGAPHFFSLSYVKGVDPTDPMADKLIAASVDEGEWVLINYPEELLEDIFISLGYYEPQAKEWLSSGDIISIQVDWTKFKTYATLKCPNYTDVGCESDWLAEINPETGEATLIGQTGYQQIFGLGYWGEYVYGFTNDGDYVVIDTETGDGSLIQHFDTLSFWGAGNTTIPYIVE